MTDEEIDRLAERVFDRVLSLYLSAEFTSHGLHSEWRFPDGRRITYDGWRQERTVYKRDGVTVESVKKLRWQ